MESTSPRQPDGLLMSALCTTALVVLVIGGLNWGLYGLFGVDVVAMLFGPFSTAARLVYGLVGLSALCSIRFFFLIGDDARGRSAAWRRNGMP